MAWKQHDYQNIPGTYVFDGAMAHPSYAVNKLFYSFNQKANRDRFNADPETYCNDYGLPEEHKALVLEQDFLGLLRAGANIYYLAKFCVPRGISVQDAGAAFQGITGDEFRDHLLQKREGLEERLAAEGGYWNG
jgi:protocatechuate 4,5-dioxygenase alpha chain